MLKILNGLLKNLKLHLSFVHDHFKEPVIKLPCKIHYVLTNIY